MAGFPLSRLAGRSLGASAIAQPRRPSRFEPDGPLESDPGPRVVDTEIEAYDRSPAAARYTAAVPDPLRPRRRARRRQFCTPRQWRPRLTWGAAIAPAGVQRRAEIVGRQVAAEAAPSAPPNSRQFSAAATQGSGPRALDPAIAAAAADCASRRGRSGRLTPPPLGRLPPPDAGWASAVAGVSGAAPASPRRLPGRGSDRPHRNPRRYASPRPASKGRRPGADSGLADYLARSAR